MAFKGITPTSSEPVTRMPRSLALRHTSSKASSRVMPAQTVSRAARRYLCLPMESNALSKMPTLVSASVSDQVAKASDATFTALSVSPSSGSWNVPKMMLLSTGLNTG